MSDDHPQHILAVTALISNEAGEVLLVRNPQRGWEIPGGQVEQGESLETEWVARAAVLERISHPVIHDRIADVLAFRGRILYRIYSTNPYIIHAEHYINDFHEWGLDVAG